MTHPEVESTTSVSPEPRKSSELGSHVHDVGELAERLAEALGIEVTSSDEEFERVHNFFGDTPSVADEAYRAQLVEERVRAWANARPRTYPNLLLCRYSDVSQQSLLQRGLDIQTVRMDSFPPSRCLSLPVLR